MLLVGGWRQVHDLPGIALSAAVLSAMCRGLARRSPEPCSDAAILEGGSVREAVSRHLSAFGVRYNRGSPLVAEGENNGHATPAESCCSLAVSGVVEVVPSHPFGLLPRYLPLMGRLGRC